MLWTQENGGKNEIGHGGGVKSPLCVFVWLRACVCACAPLVEGRGA